MHKYPRTANTNGKYTILAAIITGVLGLTGTISAAIIGNNTGRNNAVSEVMSHINTDTSNINLTIDTKDDLIDLLNDLISKNTELLTENSTLTYSNVELQNENSTLTEEKEVLLGEIKSLKDQLVQYSDLADKNEDLKKQIISLEDENSLLHSKIEELEKITSGDDITPTPTPTHSGEKISIFGLTTFRGYDRWYSRSDKSDSYFIDTYDNEYPNAHLGKHYSLDENDLDSEPTYLLDKKYSICTGRIAWSKEYKNYSGSAWIDFYSDKTLIYSSPIITADSRLTEFSFDVSGVEKLTIALNGTAGVHIIYPEFDLIE